MSITRLGGYGGPAQVYGTFAPKTLTILVQTLTAAFQAHLIYGPGNWPEETAGTGTWTPASGLIDGWSEEASIAKAWTPEDGL